MFSSKARYGLKALAVLARKYESGEFISLDDIVNAEPAPAKYLESILTELRKHGLLLSRRGPAGGYRLARAANEISLAIVVRTLDGAFAPTTCSRMRNPVCCEGCLDMERCAIRPFARRVRDEMAVVLEGQSIQDLADMPMAARSAKQR